MRSVVGDPPIADDAER